MVNADEEMGNETENERKKWRNYKTQKIKNKKVGAKKKK